MSFEKVIEFERGRKEVFKLALEAECDKWPEPIFLTGISTEPEFPVDALPKVMRDAVLEYASYGQQPISMIASTALAATSLVSQGLVDVARDEYLVSPTSLSLIVIAESGERKSACDKMFSEGIREWETKQRERQKLEYELYQANERAWQAEVKALENAIKKAAQKGNPTHELKTKLQELYLNRPVPPPWSNVFIDDASLSGLAKSLAQKWPSAALWSSEGGSIINSHATSEEYVLKFFSFVNKLWTGEEYRSERSSVECLEVGNNNHRLSVWLQIQPAVFKRLIFNDRGLSRDSGFLSRFFITWPVSTIGLRKYKKPDRLLHVEHFNRVLFDLLSHTKVENLKLQTRTLRFEVGAFEVWREFHDKIEQRMAPGGDLEDFRDFGSKAPENVARVAGIFHVLECGPEGVISVATIESAVRVVSFYLQSTVSALLNARVNKLSTDADKLANWLVKWCTKELRLAIPLRIVSQYGPAIVRGKAKYRNELLNILKESKVLEITEENREKKCVLNPRLLIKELEGDV